MRGELCPFDHGTDPVVLEDVVIPGVTGVNNSQNQYNSQPLPSDGFAGANMLRPPPAMGKPKTYRPISKV